MVDQNYNDKCERVNIFLTVIVVHTVLTLDQSTLTKNITHKLIIIG
jgi:hypothetical protein